MSDTTSSISNDQLYDGLLIELSANRHELDKMLDDISSTRELVKHLFPKTIDKVDYKMKFMMEERMKAITAIYGIELSIRKQKEGSIKTEIELRRRLSGEEDNRTLKDFYEDTNALAKALERMELDRSGESLGVVEFDGEETGLDMAPALSNKKG